MSAIREKFFGLTLRERLIALVLVAAAGIFWLSLVIGGFKDLAERQKRATADLEFQETVLSRAGTVEAKIEKELSELDSQESLTASSFAEAVDGLSRDAGLAPDLDPVDTRNGELVSVHELDLSFDDVAIVPLIDFTRRMQERSLPVSIKEMILTVNPRTPERVDVKLRLSGFEFNSIPSSTLAAQ